MPYSFNLKDVERWVEQHNIVNVLQDTIRCNTVNPPGNEILLAQKIQKILHSYGIDSELFLQGKTRANLIASIKGEASGKRLVFNGHLDTVDVGTVKWKVPPFSAEIIEGKVYGRGATDMKSGLVALMFTMIVCQIKKLIRRGEIIFVATFGEEACSLGAKHIVENGYLKKYDAMIIGEPTHNELVVAHKGALWVEVKSVGKTAHGSMPNKGTNAIEGLIAYLNEVRKEKIINSSDPLLSESTIALTRISGGNNFNVIPDCCKATLDLRTLPKQNHQEILTKLNRLAHDMSTKLNNFPKVTIQCVNNLSALETDKGSEIVQHTQSVLRGMNKQDSLRGMNYYTDGSTFGKAFGGDIIVLGPGIPEKAHQPDEYVEIEAFVEAIYIYLQVASRYLG